MALTDIRAPLFCLATETDHVSPWRSVYKLALLTDTDVDVCLTSGGHNSGVLSEPGHSGRHYRTLPKKEGATHLSVEDWLNRAHLHDGSWWPEWGRLAGGTQRPEAAREKGARAGSRPRAGHLRLRLTTRQELVLPPAPAAFMNSALISTSLPVSAV